MVYTAKPHGRHVVSGISALGGDGVCVICLSQGSYSVILGFSEIPKASYIFFHMQLVSFGATHL